IGSSARLDADMIEVSADHHHLAREARIGAFQNADAIRAAGALDDAVTLDPHRVPKNKTLRTRFLICEHGLQLAGKLGSFEQLLRRGRIHHPVELERGRRILCMSVRMNPANARQCVVCEDFFPRINCEQSRRGNAYRSGPALRYCELTLLSVVRRCNFARKSVGCSPEVDHDLPADVETT